ncbi:MAG: hypothetical protein ACRDF4_09060 [Rhabdochlamydiaceae bacterium]
MRLESRETPTSTIVEKRIPSERLGIFIVVTGICLLLSTPYLNAYSYSTTVGEGSHSISITYYYPFEQFVPIALILGLLLIGYGIFVSRQLLSRHKREIGLLFIAGGTLTLISLLKVNHPLDIGPGDAYYYGFPFPALVKSIGSFPPLVSGVGWFPDLFAVYDVAFWTAIACLTFLVLSKLNLSRLRFIR